MPRGVARWMGTEIGKMAYRTVKRLRRVGLRNLEIAYPELDEAWREQTLRGVYCNL